MAGRARSASRSSLPDSTEDERPRTLPDARSRRAGASAATSARTGALGPAKGPQRGGLGGPAPRLVTDRSSHSTSLGTKRAAPPVAYVPKSCRACEAKTWSIVTWAKTDPSKVRWFCYSCRSWRHAGECARFITQRDYARLVEALKPHHVANILFLVLTYGPKAPESLEAQYRELQPRWKALEQILKRGWSTFPGVGKFEYATYIEAHQTGRPHVNVIIVSRELARYLREHPPSESDLDESASHKGKRAPRWFRDLAARAGFGPMSSLRHAGSKRVAASYVTKFEKGATAVPGLSGEATKLSQLPVWAPRGFRRTRSSKGFLPKLNDLRDPNRTGELKRVPAPALMLERQAMALRQLLQRDVPSAVAIGEAHG